MYTYNDVNDFEDQESVTCIYSTVCIDAVLKVLKYVIISINKQ